MKLALLVLSLIAPPTFAGIRVGNAAHVMICSDRPNVVLLDLWEAEWKHHLTLSTFPGLAAPQIVNVVLERLGQRFPMLAEQMGEEFRFYNTKGNNTSKAGRFPALPHFADNLPSECGDPIVSAFQRDPVDADDTLYNYSSDLRARTDEVTFAAQSYHEVAYQMGIRHGLDHPLGIRQQTGLAFSEVYASAPDQTWIGALANSFVDLFQVERQWLPIFNEPMTSCNPSPRRANSCPLTVPPQAAMTFDAAKALQSVTYTNDRVIPLGDPATALTAIKTAKIEVIQRDDLKAFKFTGYVQTTDRVVGSQSVPFKGYYVLNTHVLCGRIHHKASAICRPASEFFGVHPQLRVEK